MNSKVVTSEALSRQIAQAQKAGVQALKLEPVAAKVRFESRSRRVIVELKSGISFLFPVDLAEGLTEAGNVDLKKVELTPSGQGLHWPTLDVDLSIPHLLQGFFGSKTWMRSLFSEMGRKGGSRQSPLKTQASRCNGKLGGRPRKAA